MEANATASCPPLHVSQLAGPHILAGVEQDSSRATPRHWNSSWCCRRVSADALASQLQPLELRAWFFTLNLALYCCGDSLLLSLGNNHRLAANVDTDDGAIVGCFHHLNTAHSSAAELSTELARDGSPARRRRRLHHRCLAGGGSRARHGAAMFYRTRVGAVPAAKACSRMVKRGLRVAV